MKANADYGRVKSARRIVIELKQEKGHPIDRVFIEQMIGNIDSKGDLIFESLMIPTADQRTILNIEDIPHGFTVDDIARARELFTAFFIMQADKDYKPKQTSGNMHLQ